mgnify:CR=1 FL=1
MKKLILIFLTLFTIQQVHAQSFMDKMKDEKAKSSTPTKQTSNAGYNGNTQTQTFQATTNNTLLNTGSYYQIKNRWKSTYLKNERNEVVDGTQSNSSQWEMEKVKESGSTKFFMLKNKVDGNYLHCGYGSLRPLKLGQMPKQYTHWESIPVPGTKFVQLRNRATSLYIHNENGALAIGSLGKPGWHSAQWQILPMDINPSSGAYSSTPTKQASKEYYANSTMMYFRYTDQVQADDSLNLKVGDRIRVLPNQQISNSFLEKKLDVYDGKTYYGKTGLSFDPNKPKICGQTFTVASISPLKFKEEFPENMRNAFNSSFAFKVVKL